MTVLLITACLAAIFLAFANGANDNSKTVATLVGSRTMGLRPAVVFSAIMTLLGSLAAILLAGELTRRFGGKGIVDAELVGRAAFPVCVGFGAAATVMAATLLGLPVSTTHAMVGSIVGIGVSAGALHAGTAASVFLVPLAVSPLIALVGASALYLVFRGLRLALGMSQRTCLCVGREVTPVSITAEGAMVVSATGVAVSADQAEQCRSRYVGRFVGIDAQRVLDAAHLFSAAALSFARGLNDTPKIAAVMIAAAAVAPAIGFGQGAALVATGVAIATGGLLAVRRVARTMSYRITEMNDGQAFTANLTAAILVIFASGHGVPVRTTHVTCGGLFGIGMVNRRAHRAMIGKVLAAWVITLPVSAVVAGAAWRLLG